LRRLPIIGGVHGFGGSLNVNGGIKYVGQIFNLPTIQNEMLLNYLYIYKIILIIIINK